jgi:valyl-tRNA synthetase
MSKSLGNGIDPLWILDGASANELPDYAREQHPGGLPAMGTDALRFTLLTGSTPGKDLNLNLEHVEANRNFANKLWNATRLVIGAVSRAPAKPATLPEPTLADRWVRSRLARLLVEVERLFDAYQFGEGGRQIHEFFWGEFADWYLEISKLQMEESPGRAWLTARTMVDVLDACLRLLHPYTPYVTEELWGHLRAACWTDRSGFAPKGGWEEALIIARWPESDLGAADAEAEERFVVVMELIRAIRNARAEKGVEPRRRIAAIVSAGPRARLIESQREVVAALARLDPGHFEIHAALEQAPAESVPLVAGAIEAYLPLAGLLDAAGERARIAGEIAAVDGQIRRLETLLAGAFAQRAPADVVARERARLEESRESKRKLEGQLRALG